MFLDRDGVINLDRGYAYRPDQLEFTSSAAAGIRAINDAGMPAVVVTNQSGVARGLYGLADIDLFHAEMQRRLAAEAGARIDAFYACPYHPDGIVPQFAREHEDRKPRPGMILRAMRDMGIASEGSVLIGDKPRDVAAAEAAGIRGVLVETDRCDLLAEVRRLLETRSP